MRLLGLSPADPTSAANTIRALREVLKKAEALFERFEARLRRAGFPPMPGHG